MTKREEKSYEKKIDDEGMQIFSSVIKEHANILGFYILQLHDKEKADAAIIDALADSFVKGTRFGFKIAAKAVGFEMKAAKNGSA